MLKTLIAFMLCCCTLLSCRAKSTDKIDRELRELDAAAIAAAGIDTTQLNPIEKLLLRQLVTGEWIQKDQGELQFPVFELTEQDYLVTEECIAELLREQGYVAPTPELFRKQVQHYFGFEPGDQQQHMTFEGGDAGWVKTEEPFNLDYNAEEGLYEFHFDPDNRQVTLLLDLPTLTDYRTRYPQLAAVEKYVNREKRLSLLLDKFMPDLSKKERAGYSLTLYGDCDPEWFSGNSRRLVNQLASYNRYLFNGDPASFGLMLIRRDPLIDYISYLGGLRPPKLEVGQPISSLIEFHGTDSLTLRHSSWSVLAAAKGDLNGDEEQDLALVIGLDPQMLAFDFNNPDSVSRSDFNDDTDYPCEQLRNRILIIAMSEKGEQRIHTIQPNLIPRFPDWNSNADDPFEFLEIENGNLVLTERSWMSAGSWWMSVDKFTFGYDPASKQLLFNEYYSESSHRATDENIHRTIELKRGMSTRISTEQVENPASPDGMSTVQKTLMQSFAPIPLLSIDTLKRGAEYRVSKETDEEQQIMIYTLE